MKKTDNVMIKKERPEVFQKQITMAEAKQLLPENMKHLELGAREYKFVAVYCTNNFNAVEACKAAGFEEVSEMRYRARAYTLLNQKAVVEAVRLFIDQVIQPYRDRLELELLNTYYRRATYDISTFYTDGGYPRTLDEIPEEWKLCIDDMKFVKVDKDKVINAYQLPNRDSALQALYRFITGQDMAQPSTLPDDAKKKITNIYQAVMKVSVQPKKIKNITPMKNGD